MTSTTGKVIIFAVIAVVVGISVWLISDKVWNSSDKPPEQSTPEITTISSNEEPKTYLKTNLDTLLDETGRNESRFIQENCLSSDLTFCKILRDELYSKELKEWISQNSLSDCAIVKMTENDCKIQTKGLDCPYPTCFLPDNQNLEEFKFWFQKLFEVTLQNIKKVKGIIILRDTLALKKMNKKELKQEEFA